MLEKKIGELTLVDALAEGRKYEAIAAGQCRIKQTMPIEYQHPFDAIKDPESTSILTEHARTVDQNTYQRTAQPMRIPAMDVEQKCIGSNATGRLTSKPINLGHHVKEDDV